MSPGPCTIRCTHGLGLRCHDCYDQRFGAGWRPTQDPECVFIEEMNRHDVDHMETWARDMELALLRPQVELIKVPPSQFPFLHPHQLDE